MGESLTERRRVRDEGLRVVNRCQWGANPVYWLSDPQRKRRLSSCQQPRYHELRERYSESLGLRVRRRLNKSGVKSLGPTEELRPILLGLRETEVSGTDGGAVKCVDIIRNTGGESGSLGLF